MKAMLNMLKFQTTKKLFNLSKNPFAKSFTIYNPNTLIFTHKRELEKYQKQKTRMRSPKSIEELQLSEEIDFEPGLEYLGQSEFLLRVCKKKEQEISPSFSSPEDGFIQLIMPFDKDPKLRKSYRLLHYERMRYGKLLEILDYISGFSAYRFNNIVPKSKQATMVTAGVDTIELFREVNLSRQMVINAYPTWTGESSMEVRLDIYNGGEEDVTCEDRKDNQKEKSEESEDAEESEESDHSFLGSANFVYVMRDATNYGTKKKVATLDLTKISDKCEKENALLRQEIGAENKKRRLKIAHQSLFRSPPTPEESALLHEQFVTYKKNKDLLLLQSLKGIDIGKVNIREKDLSAHVKTIQETKMEKSVLMHSQNINVNGHVFGGYIMREALELGYVTAYMHSNKQNPQVISVDSVTFHKPVIIGSVAQFIAHISLVDEELLHVVVEVFNYVDNQPFPSLTTTINITYKTKTKTPRVIPTTYECGVKYLEAKRIIEKLFSNL